MKTGKRLRQMLGDIFVFHLVTSTKHSFEKGTTKYGEVNTCASFCRLASEHQRMWYVLRVRADDNIQIEPRVQKTFARSVHFADRTFWGDHFLLTFLVNFTFVRAQQLQQSGRKFDQTEYTVLDRSQRHVASAQTFHPGRKR